VSREVRMVPANWQHPLRANGQYKPLFDEPYSRAVQQWDEGKEQWERGFRLDWSKEERVFIPKFPDDDGTYEDLEGERPVPEKYMPEWPESDRTHYQMYETTSEGTPISPVIATPEDLARWLADNKASAFGAQTATYQQWLCTIKQGSAPSMIFSDGKLRSGVEACCKKEVS